MSSDWDAFEDPELALVRADARRFRWMAENPNINNDHFSIHIGMSQELQSRALDVLRAEVDKEMERAK